LDFVLIFQICVQLSTETVIIPKKTTTMMIILFWAKNSTRPEVYNKSP